MKVRIDHQNEDTYLVDGVAREPRRDESGRVSSVGQGPDVFALPVHRPGIVSTADSTNFRYLERPMVEGTITGDGDFQRAKFEMLFTSARQASIPFSVISTICLETPLSPRTFSLLTLT